MSTIYFGTDVAFYQYKDRFGNYSPINWPTYAANKDFVFIKAAGCDAGLYTDSTFIISRDGARAQAGLRIGYYFFGDANVDAATAANYFISVVSPLNNGEILCLDIENHSRGTTPDDTWASVFITACYDAFGFYPFVYMSQFSPTSTSLAWKQISSRSSLWMANYGLASTTFSSTAGNADTAWGGGAGPPNYRLLQYSSSGSVAGIAPAVDLDSFYSPNNTLADWDALGYQGTGPPPTPPPASPGTLTVATVSGPTIAYTEPSLQTVNVPNETYDQVLFSTKFPTSITSSSWPVNIAGPPTGLAQYAYPIGNYTYNISGVSNLNDYGFISAGDYGQFPGTLPTVVVQPIVESTGSLSFDVVVNNITGSVTVDLVLNIALMACPYTTSVDLSSVSQVVSRSSAYIGSPRDYSTYRRIYFEGATGAGAGSFAHGQLEIPNLSYWVQDAGGSIEPQPVSWSSSGHTTAFGISMDATQVYTYVDAANAICFLRLYKDN